MRMAIAQAKKGKAKKQGGPFGAVIVRDGNLVCRVHNKVKKKGDPTQHAELLAIQVAAKLLGREVLKHCVLYTSCEPCMMCLGASHWAGFKAIYFGASADDAKAHGFVYSDSFFDVDEVLRHKEFHMTQLLRDEALAVWQS